MKVSVIIPNFNHAAFLERRIESVLNQSYQDFEMIILDDCSTDNSRDIIENYRYLSKVTHIVYNYNNSGSPFAQWQQGVALAKGEYIWIAESDDWAEPSFLEILVDKLHKNPSIGLAYCQSNIVDADGDFISINKSWTNDINKRKWRKGYLNNGIHEIKSALCFKNTIPNASAVLIRKELIDNDFIFPVHMKMAGDWFCWIQLLEKTNVLYVPLCLNNFRKTPTSSRMHNTNRKITRRIIEEIHILNYLLHNHLISLNTYQLRIKGVLKLHLPRLPFHSRPFLYWYKIKPHIIKIKSLHNNININPIPAIQYS